VIGEEGRKGSGKKKRARWSLGEAEIVWWNAWETRWARRSSRCERLMRICSRSSGRAKVRIAAVGSRESDIVLTGDFGRAAKLSDLIVFDSVIRSNAFRPSQSCPSEYAVLLKHNDINKEIAEQTGGEKQQDMTANLDKEETRRKEGKQTKSPT
jgi:hypothetical protein